MVDGNIMTPNPVGEEGQQAAANNLSGGVGVPSQSPPPGSDSEQEVVKVVDNKMEGNRVIVVIESESTERLMSTDAKNLAYAQRFKFGMTNAGIEALAGVYVAPEEYERAKAQERDVAVWRREFRLTPGI
jgi:hypothetical protein